MKTKLNTLYLFLKKNNLSEEASAIGSIVNKIAMDFDGLAALINNPNNENKSKPSGAGKESNDLQKWRELLDATVDNNFAANMLDSADEIKDSAGKIRSKNNIPEASKEEQEDVVKALRNAFRVGTKAVQVGTKGVKSLNAKDGVLEEDRVLEEPPNFDEEEVISGLIELAGNNDIPPSKASEIADIVKSGSIEKEAIFKSLLRAAPYVGLATSITLFLKNMREAYLNAQKIIQSLPLKAEYNLSSAELISPTVVGKHGKIKNLIDKFSNDPDSLMDILEIITVVKAFQLDFIFAITNGIALVLDAISVILLFFPEPTGLTKILSGVFAVADFFIQLVVLMGTEMGSEYASDKFWGPLNKKIQEIAKSNIDRLSSAPLLT